MSIRYIPRADSTVQYSVLHYQVSGDKNLSSTGLSPALRLSFFLEMISGVTGGRTSRSTSCGSFDCFIVLLHLCLARLLLTCFLRKPSILLSLSMLEFVFFLDMSHYFQDSCFFLHAVFISEGRNTIRVSMVSSHWPLRPK